MRRSASPAAGGRASSANAGAYVQLNRDGTGTIVTGAQENGTGSVMAMPAFVAEELGMKPEDFSLLYQDTDAAPWDMGSCGSQTTFNSVRAVIAAAGDVREQLLDAAAEQLEAARDDLELVEGTVRVKGSPDKSVTIADLAGGGDRSTARARAPLPEAPPVDAEGCVGRHGIESFLAPQLITHAVRVKVDRETGVVRVLQVAAAHDSGVILNRIGADGQVYGGVVMGIGQALSEGTQLDEDGRQRNPHLLDYKLVTASDAPQIDIAWVETDTPNAGPERLEGGRRAAVRPDRGRGRERDREGDGRARAAAADDAGACLGGSERGSGVVTVASFVSADLGRRGGRGARRRRAARRRWHRPRRRRAPGQGAAAGEPRRDRPHRRAARHHRDGRRAARSARSSRTRRSPRTRSCASGSPRWRTPRRSSAPMRHARRERSAAT